MSTTPIRRRIYKEPVTAVQIGELARDIQTQVDELNASLSSTNTTTDVSANPTGPAGGDLSGTYPDPDVAAVHETSGPTQLTIGAIADGETLVRSGSTIIGSAGAPPGGPAGGDLDGTYPDPEVAAIHETSGPTKLTIGIIADGEYLIRSGTDLIGTTDLPPTGPAGGDLAATYPNPEVAAIHETSGPTKLTIGSIADGETLVRSGTTLIGSPGAPPGGAAGGDLAGTYPDPEVAAVHETSGPTKLTVGGIADGDFVIRSGTNLVGATPVGGTWLPDMLPVIPYADDDEFLDGSGTPTGWAVFDPLVLGFSMEEIPPTFLKCTIPYNATNRLLAAYRAAPAESEYSIWAKFSQTMITGSAGGADDWDMSLVFMEGNSGTDKFAGLSLSYNSSIVARTWATYSATPSNVGPTDPLYVQPVIYVRMGYDGTNFLFHISDDGIGWNQVASVAKTFTPAYVGFAFTNSKNTGTKYALFDFYRVITGVGSSTANVLAEGRATTNVLGLGAPAGPPTGPAGGDLSGTYPDPDVVAMHESSGPTQLAIGAIANGEFLKRSGSTIIGTSSTPPTGAAGGDLDGTYPDPEVAAITETSGPTQLVIGAIADGEYLKRSGATLVSTASTPPTGAAGGDLTGTYPNPTIDVLKVTAAKIALATITDAQVAVANKDGAAGTYSMRTLGTTAVSACSGADARLSDSRAPTGAATGDLAATYPAPTVAAIHTGVTKLTIGTITDGQFLKRSGTTLISAASAPPSGAAGGDLGGTYPNPTVLAIHDGATKLTISGIADGQLLIRSGLGITGTNKFDSVLKAGVNGFRLTGVTATPVMTADSTTLNTIFLTPYKSNTIALYNGATWDLLSSAEVNLAVSGRTADLPFDVFAYNNVGTLTLEFLNWTNATTRATALTRQDGVWVRSGAPERRYMGTCRPRSATTFHWIQTGQYNQKFDLWNADNRVACYFLPPSTPGLATHTYNGVWHQYDTAQVDIVVGLQEETFVGQLIVSGESQGANQTANISFGYDSATPFGLTGIGIVEDSGIIFTLIASIAHRPTIGRHYYAWLETSSVSLDWYDYNSGIGLQSGMTGTWTC